MTTSPPDRSNHPKRKLFLGGRGNSGLEFNGTDAVAKSYLEGKDYSIENLGTGKKTYEVAPYDEATDMSIHGSRANYASNNAEGPLLKFFTKVKPF